SVVKELRTALLAGSQDVSPGGSRKGGSRGRREGTRGQCRGLQPLPCKGDSSSTATRRQATVPEPYGLGIGQSFEFSHRLALERPGRPGYYSVPVKTPVANSGGAQNTFGV